MLKLKPHKLGQVFLCPAQLFDPIVFVWFLCFYGMSICVVYLMPKPFLKIAQSADYTSAER